MKISGCESLKTADRLPVWFRQNIPAADDLRRMRSLFEKNGLNTVCQSARCPNMGRCWSSGVATFMILGDVCTRACRFCAVETGVPSGVDRDEPRRIAKSVAALYLKYVVITSVTRDDLPDGGASQFAETVTAVREFSPQTKIELLVPDFKGDKGSVAAVLRAKPDVIGHNIETVRRVFGEVRPQGCVAKVNDFGRQEVVLQRENFDNSVQNQITQQPLQGNYERSLDVLRTFRNILSDGEGLLKSGFMVGLGETDEDVWGVLQDLKGAGCDLVTIGQYLAPTKTERHRPVARFVSPEEFAEYRRVGLELGFKHVEAGPLVRSSFMAEEGYRQACQI